MLSARALYVRGGLALAEGGNHAQNFGFACRSDRRASYGCLGHGYAAQGTRGSLCGLQLDRLLPRWRIRRRLGYRYRHQPHYYNNLSGRICAYPDQIQRHSRRRLRRIQFSDNQFVIGIDGDYTWAGLTGALTEPSALVAGAVVNTSDKINWISTVTGRAGYAINNWLLFVKGGWAWAGFSETGRGITPAGVVDSATSASSTRNGWTVGPGVEWGFAQHWSAKLEYDYVDFNRANFNLTATNLITGVVTVSSKSATSSLSMLKAGIDYRF